MDKPKFIILATEGITTNLLYEKLNEIGQVEQVIIENRVSSWKKINSRFRKLTFFKVVDQLLFLTLISPILNLVSRNKIKDIIKVYKYSNQQIPENLIHKIDSVNDISIIEHISKINCDIIFLNGTRILHKDILNNLQKSIYNIHVGITPKYRGIHGGYWALANNDKSNFGVTLHKVDAGIDTGNIISQKIVAISKTDNYATYPIKQFIEGLNLVSSFFDKKQEEIFSIQESKLYYHPGFFQYLYLRITKKVK